MRTTKWCVFVLLLATSSLSVAQSDDDLDASTDTTYDGLVQVRRAGFRNVWIKPDVDISMYQKVILAPSQFHYREVSPRSRASSRASSASEFAIEESSRSALEETMAEILRTELGQSRYFTLTDEPGEDTVRIWAGLYDVVSRVPPEIVGRGQIYLREVGQATLVLHVEDSMTREILARVVDRRAAQSAYPLPSTPITTRAEVRRLGQTWARLLRNGLDKWHESAGSAN